MQVSSINWVAHCSYYSVLCSIAWHILFSPHSLSVHGCLILCVYLVCPYCPPVGHSDKISSFVFLKLILFLLATEASEEIYNNIQCNSLVYKCLPHPYHMVGLLHHNYSGHWPMIVTVTAFLQTLSYSLPSECELYRLKHWLGGGAFGKHLEFV